jgi:trehalose-phosphatase
LLDAFFATLESAPARALIVDYDGTLAPFRGRREQALPHPGVPEAIGSLLETGGTRLIVVSGRPLADLEARTDWIQPRPDRWGSHGLERRASDGSLSAPPIPLPLTDLLDRISQWIEERGWMNLFERKPYGFALHERPDPERFPEARAELLEWWQSSLDRRGLVPLTFDGGLEFRPSGSSKARAVESVLAELPPAAVVAYLGDDRTDEDAFLALRGRGLRVLVRDRRRPSEADLWLRPPEELIAFFSRWERATRSPSPVPSDVRRGKP